MRRFLPITLVPLALVLGCSRLPTDGAGATTAPRLGIKGSEEGTTCVLNTQLRAENETPPTASEATGHAQIKLENDGSLEYQVSILNQAGEMLRAAHIHHAPAGVPGPIVVPLFTGPTTDTAHLRLDGEVPVSAALAEDLCAHPEQYYVNFHTVQYPAGAIRGQLR